MIRWWFVTVNLYTQARENWPIRLRERSDTRELSGEALIDELRKAGL